MPRSTGRRIAKRNSVYNGSSEAGFREDCRGWGEGVCYGLRSGARVRLVQVVEMSAKVSERRLWVYAATFGALWGSVESVLGVFLHALRVPFTGFLLTLLSVLILAAQRYLCPVRGVTLATGAIAASIRAVAPATVIWGPLLGITMEAALFELACLLIPHRLAAVWLGGGLAATWTLSQGVLTKLVVYGAGLADVVVEMTSALLSRLGLDSSYVWAALAVVGGGSLLGGALAAWAGFRMASSLSWSRTDQLPSWALPVVSGATQGTRVAEAGPEAEVGPEPAVGTRPDAAADAGTAASGERPAARRWAPLWRVLGWLGCIGYLVSQWVGGLWVSAGCVALLAWCLTQLHPGPTRRVFRLRFWLFSILVTLAAGLFLGPKEQSASQGVALQLSLAGLEAGFGMLLRALFLVLVTVWLGVFLAKSGVRKQIRRVGPHAFFDAVRAASETVPALVKRLAPEPVAQRSGSGRGAGYRHLFTRHYLRGLLHEAHQVALERLATHLAPPVRPRVLLAWGSPGSGKTTWMLALARALQQRGVRVDGVVQPKIPGLAGVGEGGATHRGYEVLALASGRRKTVASVRGRPRKGAMRFHFHRGIFNWAAGVLEKGAESAQCLMLDEFGHLEAQGLGHFPALTRAMFTNRAACWVLCVRETRKEDALRLLSRWNAEAVSIASTPAEALGSQIQEWLAQANEGQVPRPL